MFKKRFFFTLFSVVSSFSLASCGAVEPYPKFFTLIWKGEQGVTYSPMYKASEVVEIDLNKTLPFYLDNGNVLYMLSEDLMHSMSIAINNSIEKYSYFSIIRQIADNRLSFSLRIYDEKLENIFLKMDINNLIYSNSIISHKSGEKELVFMPLGIGFDGLSFVIQDDFWSDMLWTIDISECEEGKIVNQIVLNWEFAFYPVIIDILENNLQNLVIYPHFFSETKIIE